MTRFAPNIAVSSTVPGDARQFRRDFKRAVRTGFRQGGDGAKRDLRGQVLRARLGLGVARAWRHRLFTDGPFTVTAFVWTKAPDIIRAFDRATVIRSRDGFFLAIPTENAPKKGRGGKRIDPTNFPEERFGPLRFVFRRGRPSLLVVDGLVARGGKRGGFRRATIRKATKNRGEFVALKGLTTVPMFTLVPQVTTRKRLNVDFVAVKWVNRIPGLVDRALEQAA